MKDLYEALRDLVGLFERRNIPYVLVGGFAVRAYAFPRDTGDFDFTVVADLECGSSLPLWKDLDFFRLTSPDIPLPSRLKR